MEMKKEKIAVCYKTLYIIDKIIIKEEPKECFHCLNRLLKLKGYLILEICTCKGLRGDKILKQIEKEIDDLLWNINTRIEILSSMDLAPESEKRYFIGKYRNIYNSAWKPNIMDFDAFDVLNFCAIGLIGGFTIHLLRCANVNLEGNSELYIILLTYIYFLSGRIKKISSDGIRFWKPKNWKENL